MFWPNFKIQVSSYLWVVWWVFLKEILKEMMFSDYHFNQIIELGDQVIVEKISWSKNEIHIFLSNCNLTHYTSRLQNTRILTWFFIYFRDREEIDKKN